jgi:hypothetical protein
MTDLHDRLGRLTGADVPTSADQADADLDRARRALRRRRTWRAAGASAFAAAALVAVVTYGTADVGSPAPDAHLVAYQGQQPQGFTIDKVPAGWEIQGGTTGSLTIAPAGAKDKNPDVFADKIAIMLQSKDDHRTPQGTPVTVGGNPGVIEKGLGTEHGRNLWVKEPDDVWMEVQIWDARGWSQDEIVEFGDGVHVEPGAVRGVG